MPKSDRMVPARDLTLASDASLVVAIARYRQEALAETYRRHAGAVYALARRLLCDHTLAEEVVQEVFLRLWGAPEKFDPERGSLRSYLLAQCHGRSVDLIRSEQSRRDRELKEHRQQAEAGYDIEHEVCSEQSRRDRELKEHRQQAEAGYDIEHEVWDLAVADHVREAISDLPVQERRAIELAYLRGHTYREVAALLGQPEGTVKSRIRAGLRRMRGVLVDAGVGGSS